MKFSPLTAIHNRRRLHNASEKIARKFSKKHTFFFAAFVVLVSLASCYRDLGNYDYARLNEFGLSGLPNSNVVLGDTLRLNPVLNEETPDSLRFDYTWTVEFSDPQRLQNRLDSVAVVIGREKQLEFVVENLVTGAYTVKVEAMDRNTGVRRFTFARLTVTSPFELGYMLLEETADGGDISLVNDSTVHRSVFSRNNGGMHLPAPLRGIFMNNSRGKALFVSAGDFHQELDVESFRVIRSMEELFPSPLSVPMRPVLFSDLPRSSGNAVFVWNSGYISRVVAFAPDRSEISYYPPVVDDYELAPFLGYYRWGSIGYDRRNGRFLSFPDSWQGSNMQEFLPAEPGDAFDFNLIGKEMVYGSNIYRHNEYISIFRDDNQNMHVYNMRILLFDNVRADFTFQIDLAAVPEIDRASGFAASYNLPILYYTVDNKVYIFDVPNRRARLFFEFPAGENISTINWGNKEGSREIAISTYDGHQGRFYVFVPNAAGTFTSPRWPVQGGFGRIIQTKMKYNVRSPFE